jgi:hypothetical protein
MRIKMTLVLTLAFIFLCGFRSKNPNYVEFVEEGVIVHGAVTPLYLTAQERIDLMGIATNEAGNQGAKGMALVMRVVLNRVEYDGYGDDIHSVIFATGQFATAGMPTNNFSKECEVAMHWIQYGWDESQGALYFCANGYNGPVPLFQYLGHWFSTK